jgi:hypothetical protein
MLNERPQQGWNRIALWTLSNAVGGGISWYISLNDARFAEWNWVGLILAVCQSWVFLPSLRDAVGWAIVTTLGWAIGLFIILQISLVVGWGWFNYEFEGLILSFFTAGPVVALAQWFVLRRQGRGAVLWIVVVPSSYVFSVVTAMIVFGLLSNAVGIFAGIIFGLITGFTLKSIFDTSNISRLHTNESG